MPSTYSNIKIQLMATGENNTTWGDVTNVNLGTALEEAIVGSADVAFSNANVTLTLTDTNATQTARNMRLNLTGTATSGYNLVVPAIEKPYIVNNGTDGTITVKNSTGTGIAVPAGKTMWVYNNGTSVVDAVTHLSSLTLDTDLAVSQGGTGVSTFTSNGVLLGNGTSAISATAAGTTGQVLVGNTGSAPTWATLTSTAVTSISFGTTGLTPSTATQGAVTVAGTLGVANGGTGTTTAFTAGSVVFAGASGVYTQDNANLFWDNTNDRLGIGTSSPSSNGRLSVNGNIVLGPLTRNQAATQSVGVWSTGDPADDARANIGFTTVAGGASSSSYITFATNNYGVSGGERMRIDQSGNVGIGTTSPSAQLDSFKASGYNDIRVRSGSNQTYLAADGTNAYVGTYSNIPLLVSTNNTERMRVTAGGDVGIGTSVPDVKVSIQDAGAGQITLKDSGGTTRAYIMTNGAIGTAPTNSLRIRGDSGVALGAVGSLAMFIDTSNNVGVGTSSPGYKLDVRGGTSSFEGSSGIGAVRIAGAGGSWFWIDNPSTTILRFSSGASAGTNPMTFTDGGSLGIGTSSPGQTLQVVNAGNYQFRLGAGSTFNYDIGRSGSDGLLYFYGNQSGFTGYVFSGADGERMRITSAGNVGIGTSSPGGSANDRIVAASGSSSAAFQAIGGSVSTQFGSTSAGWGLVNVTSNHPLLISTNNTERMRIDSSGNVAIATTSPVAGRILTVNGSPTFISPGSTFNIDLDGGSGANGVGLEASFASGGYGPLRFRTGGSERARLDANGNFGVGTTTPDVVRLRSKGVNTAATHYALYTENSANTDLFYARNDGAIGTGTAANSPYNLTTASAANVFVDSGGLLYRSTSSLRYKTDVQDATHGLAEVLALRPVTYKGKGHDAVIGGLIAEEVDAAGLTEFVAYDGEGRPDALHYGNMVSLLIKAVQELTARVAQLEGK